MLVRARELGHRSRWGGAVCAAFATWLLAMPCGAQAPPAPPITGSPGTEIVIVPGRFSGELEALAGGATELVRLRLAGLGAPMEARRSAALANLPTPSVEAALALADRAKARGVLLVDLALRQGELETVLRYCEQRRRALVAVGRSRGSPANWSLLRDRAIEGLRSSLALAELTPAPGDALSLEDLASASAALDALDRGALAAAWRELDGRRESALEGIRQEIRQDARRDDLPFEEHVRLFSAMGETERAWSMLSSRVEVELAKAQPDSVLLELAGEVQSARSELDSAKRLLERSAAAQGASGRGPATSDSELALGRVLALQGDAAGAAAHFTRAQQLAPTRLEPLAELAQLPSNDAAERSRRWTAAGERAAQQLRVESAAGFLERARDPTVQAAVRARSFEVAAELKVRLQDARGASEQWNRALELGGPSPGRLAGLAAAELQLGHRDSAALALERALELEPDGVDVLRTIGEVDVVRGDLASAAAHLERAHELAPENPQSVRALGRVRLAAGDGPRALRLLREAEALKPGSASELRELAALELQHGDRAAGVRDFERAVELAPADVELQNDLARAYRAAGDEGRAKRAESMALLLGGTAYAQVFPETDTEARVSTLSPSLQKLAASLLEPAPRLRRIAVVRVSEQRSRRDAVLDWLRPRTPDPGALARELEQAFAPHAEIVAARPRAGQELFYAQLVEKLQAFDSARALDAESIATLNTQLDADAVVLARFERQGVDPTALERPCGIEAHLLVNARLLTGRISNDVHAFSNGACLSAAGAGLFPGSGRYERWNPLALGLYALLAALCSYPLLRGRGSVAIEFKLPENTRAMLSVSVTSRRRKVKPRATVSPDGSWEIREKLLRIHSSERRFEGKRMVFHWRAARRRPYHVTVRGPLLDRRSGDLVGSFNAEKTVVVERGRTALVEFDMRAKDACVEVNVLANGYRLGEATVCVRGMPKSQRFVRGKPAYLYLPTGEYVIVAGGDGRVAEISIAIERELPLSLTIDVADPETQLFRECPAAMAPYMEGDFARAASELERAGQRDAARRVRALDQRARGEHEAAAQTLAEAGDPSSLAELALAGGNDAEGARLLEQAGDPARAAEIFQRQGDLRAAAAAYEQAYDYDSAALCYRDIGDLESLLSVLEKAGDMYEAGRVACALEQWDRAIRDLQQIERRHAHYVEACLILAEILAERGERDLALERFDLAMSLASADGPELAQQARYAELLEEAGRLTDALEMYTRIRRRDRNYPGARERAEELRRRIAEATTAATFASASAAQAAAPTLPPIAANRYEIIGELGRGAMGVVYKARDTVLDRMVALKKLPESMRQHELAVRFFLREARSAAALNHPNVVTLYDAGQDGDNYFLTMECLEGTTLAGILQRNRVLTARDACLLGIQAATGLGYAHASGIIHRDIKPSNLFYTRDRVVKIMDFGLARAVEEVRRSATVIAGTPYYMPPEQAEGGTLDHRSDLYALGVTLYHLCTGRVPFPEGDVAYHHHHTPVPDPRELAPELPEALAELLLALLAKEREHRPESADWVALRLKAIAKSLSR